MAAFRFVSTERMLCFLSVFVFHLTASQSSSPCQKCSENGDCTFLTPASSDPSVPIVHEYCGKSKAGFFMCCPTAIDGLKHSCDEENLGACRCSEKLCFTRDTVDMHPPYNAIIVPVLLICFFVNCVAVWKNRKRQTELYGEFDDSAPSTRQLVRGESERSSQGTGSESR